MATIKLVPKKDWEIVKEYLYADNGGAEKEWLQNQRNCRREKKRKEEKRRMKK